MKEVQIFDSEKQLYYKFNISDEEYDSIYKQGNLVLATTLLQREQEKENVVAAAKLLQNEQKQLSKSPFTSLLSCPSTSSHVDVQELTNTTGLEHTKLENSKSWSDEATNLLITLCKKYDTEFETTLKKYVWIKIAKELTEKCGQLFTFQQCDTKFKGLKNMYKLFKNHNDKSGNNIKIWKFYDVMDEILFSKPEINAKATGSSKRGLIVGGIPVQNFQDTGTGQMEHMEAQSNNSATETRTNLSAQTSPRTPSFNSNFMRKRKTTENAVEKRHKENMSRTDRFLNILDRLTTAVENNNNQSE